MAPKTSDWLAFAAGVAGLFAYLTAVATGHLGFTPGVAELLVLFLVGTSVGDFLLDWVEDRSRGALDNAAVVGFLEERAADDEEIREWLEDFPSGGD